MGSVDHSEMNAAIAQAEIANAVAEVTGPKAGPPTAELKKIVENHIYGYFYNFTEMGIARIFMQQGVFAALPSNGEGISYQKLAIKVGGQAAIIERFCYFMIARKCLSSPGRGFVAHGKTSKFFLDPGVACMFQHLFDHSLRPVAHWPDYFKQHGLVEPPTARQTPWSLSYGFPDKTNYEVMAMYPELAEPFNAAMKVSVGDMPITGMYDFGWVQDYAIKTPDSDRPLIVDVGGGLGQALKAILAESPQIPAKRCVLQDREPTIVEVKDIADPELLEVQKVAASFHEPEPIKHALVYHIRRVLNDWPDHDVINILSQISRQCASDSKVLISEQLTPEEPEVMMGAVDIFFMNFAGSRRNARHYGELAAQAGLKMTSVWPHKGSASAVIEFELA